MTTNIPLGRHAAFDIAGPVDSVVHFAARDLPHLFPEVGEHLVRAVTRLVRHQAAAHGWHSVMLWVTGGMGAEALRHILGQTHGGLVIVPDVLGGGVHDYADAASAAAEADGLLATNEVGNDIMLVLAGSGAIDPKKAAQLVEARLRMLDMSFEMLRDDLRHDPQLMQEPEKLAKDLRLLDYAYRHIGEMHKLLEYAIAHQLRLDAQKFSETMQDSVKDINYVLLQGMGLVLMHNARGILYVLDSTPQHYPQLDLETGTSPEPAGTFAMPEQSPHHDLLMRLHQDGMQPSPPQ